jgi:glucokinase
VSETVGLLGPDDVLAGAAVAFAGPTTGASARMTNWPPPTTVDADDLAEAGLPRDRTLLLNDVVAGALGVEAILESEGAGAEAFESLRDASPEGAGRGGSLVYVAPGTGLGAAVLVPRSLSSHDGHVRMACESQHTAIPAFDDEVARVIDVLSTLPGRPPTWEDLVSGRGLATIHAVLDGLEKGTGPDAAACDAARASEVARAASEGDALAVGAIGLYYRSAARFAQVLALSHLPCGRVVLGGSTTARNRALLAGSGFADAFDDNDVLREMLESVRLCAVLDEDVNLVGAMGEAVRITSR